MTGPRERTALLLSPDRPVVRSCVRPVSVPEVIGSLSHSDDLVGGRGAVRSRKRSRVSLVVAETSNDEGRSRVRLIVGASIARRFGVPFVVVEDRAGHLDELRRSALTRRLTERVVSRCVEQPRDDADVLDPALMAAIGLPPAEQDRSEVRALSLDDLDAVVRVHRSAFPDSAVTLLGPHVVDRYYRWQFIGAHPSPFAAGCWHDGELVGFVFGGLRREAVTGYARRFLPVIVLGAITHPRGLRALAGPKLASVLRLMFRQRVRTRAASTASSSRTVDVPVGGGPSFGILSIAVCPAARGSGVADELMSAAESAAELGGFERMNLTVNPDNGRAIRFYERLGWERVDGESGWEGRMIKRIGDRAGRDGGSS